MAPRGSKTGQNTATVGVTWLFIYLLWKVPYVQARQVCKLCLHGSRIPAKPCDLDESSWSPSVSSTVSGREIYPDPWFKLPPRLRLRLPVSITLPVDPAAAPLLKLPRLPTLIPAFDPLLLTADGPEVSTGERFPEAPPAPSQTPLPLPKLLDNEGGGTRGYVNPLEGTPNVGGSIIIMVNDKLEGGLVTLVDAEADEAADEEAAEEEAAE